MPLNAVGWSTEEDEKLAELVEPHSYLYNVLDPSRKNILARESTWQEIAQQLSKPGKTRIIQCILCKLLCCNLQLQDRINIKLSADR